MTKDRAFFSKYGIKKQEMLNSLANLLDEKGIKYDTMRLSKLSRKSIRSVRAKISGKKVDIENIDIYE